MVLKRPRRFRLLIGGAAIFCFLLLFGCTLLYAFRNRIAAYALSEVEPAFRSRLQARGLTLLHLDYDAPEVSCFPLRVSLRNLSIEISFPVPGFADRTMNAEAFSEEGSFTWNPFSADHIYLDARNITGEFPDGMLPREIPFRRMHEARFSALLELSELPELSCRAVSMLYDLYEANRTCENFKFKGQMDLFYDGKPFILGVYTMPVDGGGTTLRLERSDLDFIVRNSELTCSESEIDILVRNPLKAPYIIYATRKAQKVSQSAYWHDRSIPEDAYRHVLWSYLLTKEFGPAFARQITDAHEMQVGNTQAEHRMDYNNNIVGSDYARTGVEEAHILTTLLNDNRVILSPEP